MPGRNKVSAMGRKTRKDRKKMMKQQKLLCEIEGTCTYTETCIEVCCHHGPAPGSSGKDRESCQVCLGFLQEIEMRKGRADFVQYKEISAFPSACGCGAHPENGKCGKPVVPEEKLVPPATSSFQATQARTKLANGSVDADEDKKKTKEQEDDTEVSEPEEETSAPNANPRSLRHMLADDAISMDLANLPTFKQGYYLSAMRERMVKPFVTWLQAFNTVVSRIMRDIIEVSSEMGDSKITILQEMRKLAIAAAPGRKSYGTSKNSTQKVSAKEIGKFGALTRVDFLRKDVKKQLGNFQDAYARYIDFIESSIKLVDNFSSEWKVQMARLRRQDKELKEDVAALWGRGNGTTSTIEEEIKNFTLFDEQRFVVEKQIWALTRYGDFIGAHKAEAELCNNFFSSINVMLSSMEDFQAVAGPAMEKKFFDMEQKIRKSNQILKTDTNKNFKLNLARLEEVFDLIKVLSNQLGSKQEAELIQRIVCEARKKVAAQMEKEKEKLRTSSEEDVGVEEERDRDREKKDSVEMTENGDGDDSESCSSFETRATSTSSEDSDDLRVFEDFDFKALGK